MQERKLTLKGTPYEAGFQAGRYFGARLLVNLNEYLQRGPLRYGGVSMQQLEGGAMDWFAALPQRYREEMQGISDGSGVPVEKLALWSYADDCPAEACSAFLLRKGGEVWVGRNNDLWVPDLWGYATIREIDGRIATISFGLEGELWAATGINQAGLWLHYNYLPVWDEVPALTAPAPYVWVRDALETCRTLAEVEEKLRLTRRSGGMMLFAVEDSHGAIFECSCQGYVRRDLSGSWLAGTNHALALPTPQPAAVYAAGSLERYRHLTERLDRLEADLAKEADLRAVLADADIEQRGADYGTVYAALACPTRRIIHYSFGGYPAASQGNWQPLAWPW